MSMISGLVRAVFMGCGIAAALGLCGCADLRVQVHILNERYKLSPQWRAADIWKTVERVQLSMRPTPGSLDELTQRQNKLIEDLRKSFGEGSQAMEAMDNFLAANGLTGNYGVRGTTALDNLVKTVKPAFDNARTHYKAGLASADKVAEPPSPDLPRHIKRVDDNLLAAERSIRAGDEVLATLSKEIEEATRFVTGLIDEAQIAFAASAAPRATTPAAAAALAEAKTTLRTRGNEAKKPIAAAAPAAKQTLDSLIGDAGLFSDPYAARVVTAPPAYWRGIFNESYGSGKFGNTDIAIKMQSLGDFTIKGVRVDASKVTQATFAGISQAIKLAAAAYGVPVAGAFPSFGTTPAKDATTADKKASSETGDNLLEADLVRRKVEAAQKQRRAAALQMLKAVGREATLLEGTAAPSDEQRKAAIKRLKEAYTLTKTDMATANPIASTPAGAKTP